MKTYLPIYRAIARTGSRMLDTGILRLERKLAEQDALRLRQKYRYRANVEIFIEEVVKSSGGKNKTKETLFETRRQHESA